MPEVGMWALAAGRRGAAQERQIDERQMTNGSLTRLSNPK